MDDFQEISSHYAGRYWPVLQVCCLPVLRCAMQTEERASNGNQTSVHSSDCAHEPIGIGLFISNSTPYHRYVDDIFRMRR